MLAYLPLAKNRSPYAGQRHFVYQIGMAVRFCAGIALFSLLFLLATAQARAEGSKELNATGGNRAFLFSSNSSGNPTAYPFPTWGTMKVYVKVGETINVGSSAQGMGSGTINLRAPGGATYTSGNSTSVGLIANRSQEVAGPSPNAGGYTPYTRTVLVGQEGVWEIDFISPNNGVDVGNPTPISSSGNWTQPAGAYVAAFDVSVRDAANTAFLTGRVFTNVFQGILGTFDVGFNAVFNILTKDGYQYILDNNGQAGNGFSFFVNNKGFRNAAGASMYQSLNVLSSPNIQDPRADDTPSDVTHKIFFNTPAADLPATASTPGGTTWLLTTPVAPTFSNVTFTGVEGAVNKAGTNPLGANIGFTASTNGSYLIAIDVDRNGVFTDAIDRKLTGIALTGTNLVYWDGLDGLGNKVPASTLSYTVKVSTTLNTGEVHFPFFDVERNVNGIKLTRLNGGNAPDNTIYWDDTPIAVVGTPSNPIKNTTGLSSLTNGHKWGTPGASENDFGNTRGIDSWAYVLTTPAFATLNFQLQEADLEVVSITASSGCIGQPVVYTVAVKNNGPSDVAGAKFKFNYPTDLTGVAVTSVATSGVSALSAGTVSATAYDATIDMANGAIRTFTVTGIVSAMPTGASVSVSASMLRPADVTDPDATNPDAAPPTDPTAECNAQPSGTGCNNIKTNTITFAAAPNAGADQKVLINATATLTANGPGTWLQLGTTPSVATIVSPTSAVTDIKGLNAVGTFKFIFANTNGCTDTVSVFVITADTTIPNIFTPNGDGKNDTFQITGIEYFPGSQLLIYNRWGNQVYHSENYLNKWDGSGLTDGTYFYIFNRKEGSGSFTTFKGWVFLKR